MPRTGARPGWRHRALAPSHERSFGLRLLALAHLIAALFTHTAHLGPLQHHRATYYSVPPCDRQGTRTASGQRVRFGVIASDYLPLHTHIRLTRPLHGRVDFEVLDTGAPFDVWLPCGFWTHGWSNPMLYFRVVR